MARKMPRNPSQDEVSENAPGVFLEESMSYKPRWYFSQKEIDEHSPSRKDGIDHEHESHLRQLYCSYLQELGMELKVPQVTIATAMMLCHRFYMHQSHAKNHWQTVATASMFLAGKVEDTPRWLKDFLLVAYKLMYKWDPLAPQKIKQMEIYEKQKQLVVLGEQLILVTIAFDLNIEHPYKPLVAALKRLEISEKEVVKVAWNFVNDWLCTTLCLQYKPHYIAAGSIYLAAKLQKIKLPSGQGNAWWMQFDVSPKKLEEVIQHMLRLLGQSSRQPSKVKHELKPVAGNRKSGNSEPCTSSGSVVAQDSRDYSISTARISKCAAVKGNLKDPIADNCPSDSGSANSVVEDGDGELVVTGGSNQESGCKIVSVKETCQKIDVSRIREMVKRRKLDGVRRKEQKLEDETNDDAWIERELEMGIDSVLLVGL